MRFHLIALAVLATAATTSAQAGIVRVDESQFMAGSGRITFSEYVLSTVNPVYAATANSPKVSFGGFFLGQSLGTGCGGVNTGCVVGTPTGPLDLDPNAPSTFITADGANPTSPVLSGSPEYNGPVSILFGSDIAGVGLSGGYFNAIGGVAIKAYDRAGTFLGQVANTQTGIEFLGLALDDGTARIAGLEFSLVGAEPYGFAIDNVYFGAAGQIDIPVNPAVPEPQTYLMMALGLAAAFGARARRR